jgi:hypothetical protein
MSFARGFVNGFGVTGYATDMLSYLRAYGLRRRKDAAARLCIVNRAAPEKRRVQVAPVHLREMGNRECTSIGTASAAYAAEIARAPTRRRVQATPNADRRY